MTEEIRRDTIRVMRDDDKRLTQIKKKYGFKNNADAYRKALEVFAEYEAIVTSIQRIEQKLNQIGGK